MSIVNFERTPIAGYRNSVQAVKWESLKSDDLGVSLEIAGASDRTIQISGIFGGARVIVEGSNDGTVYQTLTDINGNEIDKSTGSIETVIESTRYLRPRVSGGDSTTEIIATLLFKL